MLVMKQFNTHNVRPRNISELLKLCDNQFYMHCVKWYLLCANWWLRLCFDSSCTWMKASKALTVSVSVFRGQISWRFSLSKNNISPAAPDLELILFPLWYWPVMNAHTNQQDKVFEKSDPTLAHLLALSHIGMRGFIMCVWLSWDTLCGWWDIKIKLLSTLVLWSLPHLTRLLFEWVLWLVKWYLVTGD